MKIAFVLDDSLDKTDGVQQYILTLGTWFRTKGHEVHYIVNNTRRSDIPFVHSVGKNIQMRFNNNRVSMPLPVRKKEVLRILKEQNFDVLHIQMPYSPFLGGQLLMNTPSITAVVGTFHILPASNIVKLASYFLGIMLQRPTKRIDSVFSVSPPAQDFAKKVFGIDSKILPNTIDTEHFKVITRHNVHDPKLITIVFLGRLVERKGCMYLLRAINELRNRNLVDRVRVLIYGKGPLLSQLNSYIQRQNLQTIVSFMGYAEEANKPRILKEANIAVFPSLGGESFGIVLLEAMAAGSQVVIGGNNPGYASVLGSRPKQLVDPKNTSTFANCLYGFISNEFARHNAFLWQQEQVALYNVKTVGTRLLAEYESIIAKRTKTPHNTT